MLLPTLREVPAEAEIVSHQLLLRAGLIRKSASGIYTYLPLGLRVLHKIMNIVREEMDRFGGYEILLPIVQPAELWKESNRWAVYGEEMFRLKDRHDRDFCLGPTHEEIITEVIKGDVNSYKQLPMLLYQIQNKYRDEKRPRFGLMRGREFIMKDLYSFDKDFEGLQESYHKMHKAYCNVFKRCGLKFRIVEADSGAIGGNTSHEFVVLASSGEAGVVYCNDCDYASNIESAEAIPETLTGETAFNKELVDTPNLRSVKEVAGFLKLNPKHFIKSLFYQADDEEVLVLIRGDREVNEIKLQNYLGCLELQMLDAEKVASICQADVGFVGPIGIDIKTIADKEVPLITNAVVGANKNDCHYKNVHPERDFKIDAVVDLRLVGEGEPCPKCSGRLESARGIEAGQIFQLGTKYSDALNATYTDESGKEQLIVMGCYGIGVSRTLQAAIEQNHDADGIIWPITIAPAQVVIIPVSTKDEGQVSAANEIYEFCKEAGIEVILDDRDERAGVKFKDADLLGYPIRLTVGKKTVNEGTVDIRLRHSGEEQAVAKGEAIAAIEKLIKNLLQGQGPEFVDSNTP